MTPERLLNQILDWIPVEGRKRERPRNSWRKGMDKEMQERRSIGLDGD